VLSPQAIALAAITLIAGIVQLFAVVHLGRWSERQLYGAALEGPGLYILVVAGLLAAIAVTRWLWFHPRRTREIAGAATIVVLGLAAWWLYPRISWRGCVYHGEFILHHFLVICSALVGWSLCRAWIRSRQLGRWRFVGPVAGAFGIAVMLGAHLASLPRLTLTIPSLLVMIGVGAIVAAPLLALASLPGLGSWKRRAVAGLVVLPILVRVVLAGPSGLLGGLVAGSLVPYLLASLGLCVVAAWRLPGRAAGRGTRLYLGILAAGTTYFLYSMYSKKYGFVEADLASLGHSLFGFDLPYPDYIPLWAMLACGAGFTALLTAAWESIVISERRAQGLALGLLCIAGLGLSSPQVVLMSSLGGLLLVHSLSGHPETVATRKPAATAIPLPKILDTLGEKLDLGEVVSLAQPAYTLLSLRGEVSGTAIRLQARTPDETNWQLELEVGVIGRCEPQCELRPGRRGREHAIDILAATHRLFGDPRDLERFPPALFDHLAEFPDSAFSIWPGGFRVVFGADLQAFDSARGQQMIELLVELQRDDQR